MRDTGTVDSENTIIYWGFYTETGMTAAVASYNDPTNAANFGMFTFGNTQAAIWQEFRNRFDANNKRFILSAFGPGKKNNSFFFLFLK